MRSLRSILAVPLLLCSSVALSAQGFSISASGVYAALNGDDYTGINSGLGVDLQVRYHTLGGFSVASGYQYTSHGVEGASENFGVSGFFADARYTFTPQSTPKVRPYIGGRLAITHWGISSGGADASANGTAFGPVGGLFIRMGSSTQLDLGLAYMVLHFGDAKFGGTTQPGTNTSGSAMALRVGFVYGWRNP